MRSIRPGRASAIVTGAVLAAVAVAVGSGLPAGAGPPGGFSSYGVLARADAATFEFVDTSAPAVPEGQVLFVSPATSQALVDSAGQSVAFASAPYPGEVIAAGPSMVNGFLPQGVPPLPPYPFIVSTSYPGAPSAEQVQGPTRVAAESAENDSRSSAVVGVAAGAPSVASAQARSAVARDAETDTLTAQAESRIDGLFVDPMLVIGEISSRAVLTARPGGEPTKETSFSVGTITVAGTTIGLTDDGFKLGPGALPGQDLSSLMAVLHDAGITLTFLPARETPTSVDSAGLAVSYDRDDPNAGRVRATVTLGRVRAQVNSVSGTVDVPADVASGGLPAETVAPVPPPAEPFGGGDVPEAPVEDANAGWDAAPTLERPGGGSASTAAPAPRPEPGVSEGRSGLPLAAPVGAAFQPPPGPRAGRFYASLLGAGVVLVIGTGLFSRRGLGQRGGR